jgi:hypothetical protein
LIAVAMGIGALGIHFLVGEEAGHEAEQGHQGKSLEAKDNTAHENQATNIASSQGYEDLPLRERNQYNQLLSSTFKEKDSRGWNLWESEPTILARSRSGILGLVAEESEKFGEFHSSLLYKTQILESLKARHLEILRRQLAEMQKMEASSLKMSSTLGQSGKDGRFVVVVGPLTIVVTEEETTVEVTSSKPPTNVKFVQSDRSAEDSVTASVEDDRAFLWSKTVH